MIEQINYYIYVYQVGIRSNMNMLKLEELFAEKNAIL